MERKSFLDLPAPLGYVAGIGRGATGFTTRSDIGTARKGLGGDDQGFQRNYGAGGDENGNGSDDGGDERFKDAENDVGLFANDRFDKDDEEADNIYKMIDEKMESRRKLQRLAREEEERKLFEKNNPKISAQFADLKRGLAGVTYEEWEALPEAGDLTRKNKRARKTAQGERRFYQTPDSLLTAARSSAQLEGSISTVDGTDGAVTDFKSISSARDRMLGLKLDTIGGLSNNKNKVDVEGYLTEMQRESVQSTNSLSDIRQTRQLIKGMIKANGSNASAWISMARVEKAAKRPSQARKYIEEGCAKCPYNDDIWLENIVLHREHDLRSAKIVAANAVQRLPKSIKIWLAASDLETDNHSKKLVLRKALENVPKSVQLWKSLVSLEDDEKEARDLLNAAVTMVPYSIELWLALAHMETAENAPKVLNTARKANRASHEIWIAGARLEEQSHGDALKVDKIMQKAVKALNKSGCVLDREGWIKQAELCEEENALLTCHAIIKASIGLGLEDEEEREKLSIWKKDAENANDNEKYETARAIYAYALQLFPNDADLWKSTIHLEKDHGSEPVLWEVFEKAVANCPTTEELWLMYAKEKWVGAKDVNGAREILAKAFEANKNSEDVWLAAVKLEASNNENDRALQLLEKARSEAGTERIWSKSVVFARQLGKNDDALDLISKGLKRYPRAPKLWMQKGQIYEHLGKFSEARQAYNEGTKVCIHSIPLWLLLSRLDEKQGALIRARSGLDRAALANPANEFIWLEKVRLERRAGNKSQAKNILAVALQQCPKSTYLYGEDLLMFENRSGKRKSRISYIANKLENDIHPHLLAIMSSIFLQMGKYASAKSWFDKALQLDKDYGDSWGWMYLFLSKYGTKEELEELVKQFIASDPHHGETFTRINKDLKNNDKTREEILKLVAEELETYLKFK